MFIIIQYLLHTRFILWTRIWPSQCITIPVRLLVAALKWRGWLNNWQLFAQHWANTHPSDTERKFCFTFTFAIPKLDFLLFLNLFCFGGDLKGTQIDSNSHFLCAYFLIAIQFSNDPKLPYIYIFFLFLNFSRFALFKSSH